MPTHRVLPPCHFLAALAALFVSTAAHATVYAVGCNGVYSLYDAINLAVADADGPNLIKLGTGSYVINQYDITDPAADITIEGGYANCNDAVPADGERATLTANADNRLLYVSNGTGKPRRSVILRHLDMTGGNVPTDTFGGGALFGYGNLDLKLFDVRIHDNAGENGGGIGLLNLATDATTQTKLVVAQDTRIDDNQATGTVNSTGNGGGIYALGKVDVILEDGEINGNSARRAGGGIALNSALARLDFLPLTSSEAFFFVDNTAGRATFSNSEGLGGAIYSNGGAIDTQFSGFRQQYEVYLLYNSANYGGAVYVEGDAASGAAFTFVRLLNAVVGYNDAKANGGGFYAKNAVDVTLDHHAIGTCTLFAPSSCSLVIGNSADDVDPGEVFPVGGGAFYLTGESGSQRSIARLRRTVFSGNSAPYGWAAVGFADQGDEFFIERGIVRTNSAPSESGALFVSGGPTRVLYSDVLDNTVARLFTIGATTLNVQGSILADLGTPIWYHDAAAVMTFNGCLMSNTADGIPGGALIGTPVLDADFALHGPYPAIDFCDNYEYTPISDIYGYATRNVPGIDDYYGYNDLGAVEQRDIIFHGGFGVRATD
jgi:hypothetical protein